MAWLSQNNRPIKDLEFYQRKALSFLFSSEGKDDLRCLNIPFAQLGFFNPLHFLSLIPEAMCEPYRNDKLFLACSGTVRKGDKVLLLDKESEGVLRSANFKGRRVRAKTGETEILLDGHRRPYSEDEVVPYKEYLRQQLGTALAPESNYVISANGVEWEEPTWEPGQEVYYKPEKRWATILSHETNTKGRNFIVLKIDETQAKKEKISRVSFNDLLVHSVPARIPRRIRGDSVIASSSASGGSSLDEISPMVNEKTKGTLSFAIQESDDDSIRAIVGGKRNEGIHSSYDRQMSSPVGGTETIYAEVLPRNHEDAKTDRAREKGFSFAKSFLRKKPSKSSTRPKSEYISTTVEEPIPISRTGLDFEANGLKAKSCNNLNTNLSDDDDMEQHFELVNYTNSLRSSARKIIQKQLAKESNMRTSSLRLSANSSSSRPHVAEIFSVNNSSTNKMTHTMQNIQHVDLEADQPIKPMRTKHLKSNSTTKPNDPSSKYFQEKYGDFTRSHVTDSSKVPTTYISTIFSSPTIYSIPPSHLPYTSRDTSVSPTTTPFQHYTRSSPTSISPTEFSKTFMHSAATSTTIPTTSSVYSKSCPISSTYLAKSTSPVPLPRSTNSSSTNLAVVTAPNQRPASPLFTIAPYSSSTTTTVQKASSPIPSSSVVAPTYSTEPYTRKYNLPPLPTLEYLWQKSRPNPLDYKFAPLSSSALVKKQISTVNDVALHEPEKNASTEYIMISPKFKETTGVSSDSSSHDNDSGRGSCRQTPDIDKLVKKKPGCDVLYETSPKTRRHPAFEKFQNADVMITSDNKDANIDNNLQRRYTKNRAMSKHSLAKYTTNNEDDEEEYKSKIPPPYNSTNLAHVAGQGKGIQGTENSSYADATLYALFACSNIFDKHLLLSKPGQVERGLKRDVRTILCNKIVTPLRTDAFCKAENVTHLREAMLPLSSKMHSTLIDAEEFIYLLFDSALNIESFIELSNGSKDYMHQIIARPKDRSKSQTVQFMLETSLGTAGQTFKRTPMPALFLSMPRCKGRLVYYEAIIPSLQLNITRLLQKGPKQCVCEMAATLECALCHRKNGEIALDFCNNCKGIADQIHHRLDHSPVLKSKSQKDEILNLHSIICTRGNRYVAFVKTSEHRLSPWLFYDPMSGGHPEVTLLEDFGKWLDSLEKQPGSFREFAKLHPLLKKIMVDCQILIYSKRHIDTTHLTESFSI